MNKDQRRQRMTKTFQVLHQVNLNRGMHPEAAYEKSVNYLMDHY